MNKLVVFTFFLSLAPLVTKAQNSEVTRQENQQRAVAVQEQDRLRNAEKTLTYDDYLYRNGTVRDGVYIKNYKYHVPGTDPKDTPYKTWPGPSASKEQWAVWRQYRDAYKAKKAADKKARKDYRKSR